MKKALKIIKHKKKIIYQKLMNMKQMIRRKNKNFKKNWIIWKKIIKIYPKEMEN